MDLAETTTVQGSSYSHVHFTFFRLRTQTGHFLSRMAGKGFLRPCTETRGQSMQNNVMVLEPKRSASRVDQVRSRPLRRSGSIVGRLSVLAFSACTGLLLWLGWQEGQEGRLHAGEGTGYALGIAGATLMLLLMLYPLRKRMRSLRFLGSVPGLFRIHMIFGILGPSLVLIHANFQLGSLNSSMAMLAMGTVVTSGLFGRYIYARLHRGLYGTRITLLEMLDEAGVLTSKLAIAAALPEPLMDEIQGIGGMLREHMGLLASIHRYWHVATRSYVLQRSARRGVLTMLSAQGAKRKASRRLLADLDTLFFELRQAAGLAIWERVFALWHTLHFPLFLFLFVTTVVHIIAVHLY
jgi:hypothetical protein